MELAQRMKYFLMYGLIKELLAGTLNDLLRVVILKWLLMMLVEARKNPVN